jgi:hypothetical protein
MPADAPTIDTFDVTANAGMSYYAADSANRLAPLYRRWADAAASERERSDCLRWAAAHEKIAADYWRADDIMTEIEEALKDER